MTARQAIFAGLLGWAGIAGAQVGINSVDLPPDRVEFRPGVDAVRSNCITCHSAQYVYMQPPLSREQWHAEVAKMRKAYGAPIPEAADNAIVDYLVGQNGKPEGAKAHGGKAETAQRPR
jgi:hypothetical protein